MQRLVPLTIVDIFMCLGLGVGGDNVEFCRNMCGVVGSVLSNEVITVEYVIQIMKSMVDNEMDDVENDCRLYIFVYFVVLYFPRKSKSISNSPGSVIDNLDRLSKYDWAKSVHSYLAKSFSHAFLALG